MYAWMAGGCGSTCGRATSSSTSPKGYVTTRSDPEGRRTVMDLLHGVREYVYPVGRLDYDSEGLLLLTSDGDLAARLTHPRHAVERVYESIVTGDPDESALEKLRRGVFLDGERTAPAQVRRLGTIGKGRQQTTKLMITLREGRNRQVRRMCAAIGHPVRQLTRVRMGPIRLGDLRPGQWRDLSPAEVAKLKMRASRSSPGRSSSGDVSSSGSISSVTGRSVRIAGASKPSAAAMSSTFGRSLRSFKPKRMRNSFVVP